MAAALLAEGTTTLTELPGDPRRPADGRRAAQPGLRGHRGARHRGIDVPARARGRGGLPLGVEAAGLGLRARPAHRAAPPGGRRRCPAATPSDHARSTCTRRACSGSAPPPRSSTAGSSPRRRLRGAQIWLDFPSVGATENILMAAVLADGTTVIDNAAREPEIVDLAAMLTQMGAKIEGIGTSTLSVHGVTALQPTEHRVIGDRIVGATWAFAAAMTRGEVTVRGVDPHHLDLALDKLRSAGAETEAGTRRSSPCGWTAARGDRLRHAALPGLRHRPPADGDRALRRGRRHVDDHRERVRGPVPVRRRDGAPRCRRAHRRAPRRRAGRRAALQRAGVGERHPRRRRAGARRPRAPTA